ncbi:MAG TPA: hypothetical protein VL242_09055 [Sorangium sp.]|nr:hypothetical protein [Sorangium sp.]
MELELEELLDELLVLDDVVSPPAPPLPPEPSSSPQPVMASEPTSNPNTAKERPDLIRTLSFVPRAREAARLRPPFAVPAPAVLEPFPDQPRAPRRYPEAGIFSTAPAGEPEMDAPGAPRSPYRRDRRRNAASPAHRADGRLRIRALFNRTQPFIAGEFVILT